MFSVSDNKKVRFSSGNLQYMPSTKTWRFAEHQYDCIGEKNKYTGKNYSGWIDLFGWGTGGNPTNVGLKALDYGQFDDWGKNFEGSWRTLSYDEWEYLISKRPNALEKCGIAQVSGINGLIILPDECRLPEAMGFKSGAATGFGSELFKTVNEYSASQFAEMEDRGVVFLPAGGYRYAYSMYRVNCSGCYWSSSLGLWEKVGSLHFHQSGIVVETDCNQAYGLSVRLVTDVLN